MKPWLKYTLSGLLATAFITGICFLEHLSREEDSRIACTGLEIVFRDSLQFVNSDDVKNYIDREYGCFLGQRLDSISLCSMETILDSKSAILESEAWTTPDGMLHIGITQRKPMLRFQNGDDGFYVDGSGFIIPLHPTYTAPVRVIYGNIPVFIPSSSFKGMAETEREKKWIASMLEFNNFVLSSKEWGQKIDSVLVAKGGDIHLRINSAGEDFIFGLPVNIENKFGRLEKYFSYILPAAGRGCYKIVNVKYKGQIICRKTDI